MLTSLGFQHVTVTFGAAQSSAAQSSAAQSSGRPVERRPVGLSQHTLRWYERIGLLGTIEHGDGRRWFSDRDLDWLSLLTKLRATGMPVRDMQRYAELYWRGEPSAASAAQSSAAQAS